MPHQLVFFEDKVRDLLERGRRHAEAGRHGKASAAFERALELDAGCAYALFYRAQLFLLGKQEARARKTFKEMQALPIERLVDYRELDNLPPEAFAGYFKKTPETRKLPAYERLLRAFLRRTEGDNDAAIGEMRAAVKAAPKHAAIRAFLGRVRVIYRFPDEGARDLAAASRAAPKCAWLKAWLGEALRRQGKFAAAARELDKALRLRPDYALGRVWRGAVRLALKQPQSALEDLDAALITHKDFFRVEDDRASFVNYTLGWALHQRSLARRALKDYAGAVEDLSAAHAINPRYAWVAEYGGAHGDFAQGLRELDALVKKQPQNVMARAWRGYTRLAAGDARGALADLQSAAAKERGAPWPRLWRGRAYSALGQTGKALADFTATAKAHPQNPEAHAWRGGMLRAQGKTTAAISALSKAARLDPINAWVWAWRGEAKMVRGDSKGAEADFDRALGIHLGYAEAYAWRGEARRRRGDFEGALADFNQALRLAPELKNAVVGKAAVLGETGKQAEMVRVLERAGISLESI